MTQEQVNNDNNVKPPVHPFFQRRTVPLKIDNSNNKTTKIPVQATLIPDIETVGRSVQSTFSTIKENIITSDEEESPYINIIPDQPKTLTDDDDDNDVMIIDDDTQNDEQDVVLIEDTGTADEISVAQKPPPSASPKSKLLNTHSFFLSKHQKREKDALEKLEKAKEQSLIQKATFPSPLSNMDKPINQFFKPMASKLMNPNLIEASLPTVHIGYPEKQSEFSSLHTFKKKEKYRMDFYESWNQTSLKSFRSPPFETFFDIEFNEKSRTIQPIMNTTIPNELKTYLINFKPLSSSLPLPRKKKKRNGFIESDDETDFSSDDGVGSTVGFICLVGPGTSNVIQTLAEELGYIILESNPGSKRGGKEFFTEFGESCVTRRFGNHVKFGKRKIDDEVLTDTDDDLVEIHDQVSCQEKKTLIVVEGCDILYEQDKGFWNGVWNLLEKTKVPVVFTADENPFTLQNRTIPPNIYNLLCKYIQIITVPSEGQSCIDKNMNEIEFEFEQFEMMNIAELLRADYRINEPDMYSSTEDDIVTHPILYKSAPTSSALTYTNLVDGGFYHGTGLETMADIYEFIKRHAGMEIGIREKCIPKNRSRSQSASLSNFISPLEQSGFSNTSLLLDYIPYLKQMLSNDREEVRRSKMKGGKSDEVIGVRRSRRGNRIPDAHFRRLEFMGNGKEVLEGFGELN